MDLSNYLEKKLTNITYRDFLISCVFVCLIVYSFDWALKNVFGEKSFARPDDFSNISMMNNRQNPNPFKNTDLIGKDTFNFAWISSSSIDVRPRAEDKKFHNLNQYYLSQVLTDNLKTVNDKPPVIYRYLMQGARSGDIRRTILHATQLHGIDAIIYTINAAWQFNPWLQYTKSNQRGAITSFSHSTFEDILHASKYTRISDLFFGYLQKRSALVKRRYNLRSYRNTSFSLPYPLKNTPVKKSYRYGHNKLFYPSNDFSFPQEMKKYAGYRGTLLKQNLSFKSEGGKVLKQNLKSLANSQIPTFIYISPLPSEIKYDPQLDQFMSQFAEVINSMLEEIDAENIVFRPETYKSVSDKVIHKDLIHLHDGFALVDEILKHLEKDLALELELNKSAK